jgi:hypothetical protein
MSIMKSSLDAGGSNGRVSEPFSVIPDQAGAMQIYWLTWGGSETPQMTRDGNASLKSVVLHVEDSDAMAYLLRNALRAKNDCCARKGALLW